MGLYSKHYEEAELEIAKRRDANERILEKRRAEIARKFPEYTNLHRKLAHTGKRLASLLFGENEGGNINDKLDELERENSAMQSEIEQILTKNGYGADYLHEIYSCPTCRDSGIDGGKRCKCFTNIVKRKAADEISKSSALGLSDFAMFDLSLYPESSEKADGIKIREMARSNLEFCIRYAEDFHLPLGGILMRGATGLGKTHLSLAIAASVIDRGFSVIYGSVPDLIRKMENEHFGPKKEEETIVLVKQSDLLILDDLGAEFSTQFTDSLLYDIINSRINSGLPVIANTNLTLAELRERYGERLASRLLTYDILTFYGDDIRLKKKFGQAGVIKKP